MLLGLAALDAEPALAHDLTPAAPPAYNWSGFYIGGHFGYGSGSFGPGTNSISRRRRLPARKRNRLYRRLPAWLQLSGHQQTGGRS